MTKEYYIVSKKWTGLGTHPNDITFYRAGHSGYTVYLESAGRYSKDELKGVPIGYDGHSDSFAVPCNVVDSMRFSTVPNENRALNKLMDWIDIA